MAAYLIGDIEIHDQATYDAYRDQVPELVVAYGGRFVVRGGKVTTLEGNWAAKRVVVIEFPTMEALEAFYHSDAYRPLLELRGKAANARMIAVEGV